MNWTIKSTEYINRRKCYHVRCSCGYEGIREARNVDSGRSTKCKSCSGKLTASVYGTPSSFAGCGGLSKTHYSAIKHGAERRNLEFSVSIEFLWDLFRRQGGKCALTGQDLVLVPAYKGCNVNWDIVTASVDRIHPLLGYTESNVQWVHKEINRFKNNYTQEKFLDLCLSVVRHANPEPSSGNDMEVPEKVQRLGGEESTDNPPTSVRRRFFVPDFILEKIR